MSALGFKLRSAGPQDSLQLLWGTCFPLEKGGVGFSSCPPTPPQFDVPAEPLQRFLLKIYVLTEEPATEFAGPPTQEVRISRWGQQSTKLNVGPF